MFLLSMTSLLHYSRFAPAAAMTQRDLRQKRGGLFCDKLLYGIWLLGRPVNHEVGSS
jgi:hypothetical protein